MNEKLNQYLYDVFALYDGVKSVAELKADLLADLQERFRELKAEGKDDETAFSMTIDSIGDIEQTIQDMANLSRLLERQVRVNLTAIDLQESDFAGVTAHNAKFSVSALRGFDFSNADLTGSSFKASDAREAKFDSANLTDCQIFRCRSNGHMQHAEPGYGADHVIDYTKEDFTKNGLGSDTKLEYALSQK